MTAWTWSSNSIDAPQPNTSSGCACTIAVFVLLGRKAMLILLVVFHFWAGKTSMCLAIGECWCTPLGDYLREACWSSGFCNSPNPCSHLRFVRFGHTLSRLKCCFFACQFLLIFSFCCALIALGSNGKEVLYVNFKVLSAWSMHHLCLGMTHKSKCFFCVTLSYMS